MWKAFVALPFFRLLLSLGSGHKMTPFILYIIIHRSTSIWRDHDEVDSTGWKAAFNESLTGDRLWLNLLPNERWFIARILVQIMLSSCYVEFTDSFASTQQFICDYAVNVFIYDCIYFYAWLLLICSIQSVFRCMHTRDRRCICYCNVFLT